MKRGMGLIFLVVLLLIVPMSISQIYLGTCEGYVDHVNGSMIEGASITVTVDGCTGGGCSATTTSDANFYYVVANLNVGPFGGLTVTGTKGSSYGMATGNADQFQAGFINLTLCDVPSTPVLTLIADTHDNSLITYSWTSGVDPNSLTTTDDFVLNAVVTNGAISPETRTNVAYTTYTWGVRTCNVLCCSPYAYDSFEVYNNPPPAPVLVPIPDQTTSEVQYDWSLVVDPDGDPVTYNFRLDGDPIVYDVLPVINDSVGGGVHTWRVMACDDLGACSNWAVDTFNIFNNAPTKPTLEEINYTDQTSVDLNWTSGIDPNGDPVHDRFQISDSEDFSNIIVQDNNLTAINNMLVTGLDYFKQYFWRVRTCDDKNACSSWSESAFFTYFCNATNVVSAGGGGRYCPPHREVVADAQCTLEWECDPWEACIDGKQKRNCKNIGTCGTPYVKDEYIDCFEEKCKTDSDCPGDYRCNNGLCIPVIKETHLEQISEECECEICPNWWWLIILLAVLLLISLIYNYSQHKKIKEMEERRKGVFNRENTIGGKKNGKKIVGFEISRKKAVNKGQKKK